MLRADQIHAAEGDTGTYWLAPIVADAEAGFGGPLNAFELMKAMIEAGAAAVHFEDQLSSEKKCGHLGGKVLVPTGQFLRTLTAARLAADVCGVPTILVARTDALSAKLLTSDADPADEPFLTGERTPEGFYVVRDGLEPAIARGLANAPYADLVWFETSTPDMGEAREFAQAIHEEFPGKMLAYNCSPSFNWRAQLDDDAIARFQEDLGELGYRFQFVTLAGFHSLNAAHVRARARLRAGGDERLRAAAGGRVRARGARLHGDASPARGRRRLLRRRGAGGERREELDARARRIHGGRPISELTTGDEAGTKADEIALALEDEIISGGLPPGAVLRQEQLSEHFGVSRTPVREALRRLAATGLVSFTPNRGVRVRTISLDELQQAFMVRAELEALVTGLATPNMTEKRLAELRAAQARFEELTDELLDRRRDEGERTRVTVDWVRANYRFHDVIYEAADVPLVEQVAKSARRTFLSRWRPGGPEIDDLYRQNVHQHRAILEALVAGSADGARALAHEHVLHSRRLLEVILEHRGPQAAPQAAGA